MRKTGLTGRPVFILLTLILMFFSVPLIQGQNKADSLTDQIKNRVFNRLKNFSFGFYIDAYYNMTLDSKRDTSNIVPFSSNCPAQNQIRLNLAAIEIAYHAEKVRGTLAIQYGDAPNLLAAPDAQFIKYLRQANFGFRLVKNLWLDFGYMFNPVGYESSWPVINDISTVTIGGYYEPGNVLGVKLSYKFSDKFNGGLMLGNPYSLAYGKNTHMAGMIFLTYSPLQNLSITYNNFFGNQALKNAKINNDILYNNLIVTYSPIKQIAIVGQLDYAIQTNSQMPPDTNKIASMLSGFLQAGYIINDRLALTARYEFLNDPDGFLSGVYTFNGKTRGLATNGLTLQFEYKPVKIGYLRIEYRYLNSYQGIKVFHDNTSDHLQSIIFTTGVRF